MTDNELAEIRGRADLAALTADRDRLAAENERLDQALDVDGREIDTLTMDVTDLTAENEALRAEISDQRASTRRLSRRCWEIIEELKSKVVEQRAVIEAVKAHHDAVHRHDRTLRGACGLCRSLAASVVSTTAAD